MFCCSRVPHFTATFLPHKQDGSCWELNIPATCSKRKQTVSSRTEHAGNSLGITSCLTRGKASKREDEESPKPKSEFGDRIPLQMIMQLDFGTGSQSSVLQGPCKWKEHQRYTAFHFWVLNMFFSCCHRYLVAIVVHLTKCSEPRLLSLHSQNGVMDVFRLVSSVLLGRLQLRLDMPLFPANLENMNSQSFWQHVVSGIKPTAGCPTTTGTSRRACCAQSTQLYSL